MTDLSAATPPQEKSVTVGGAGDERTIAILYRPPSAGTSAPVLVWLGGYRSDMTGTKAAEMDAFAARQGLGAIRFDYSGHGASGGDFRQGTISRWLEETIAVLDHLKPERIVLVGSSMGGWIALRLAQVLRQRATGPHLAGLVLIAPAPDFTSELIEPHLTDAQRRALVEQGHFEELSEYSPEPKYLYPGPSRRRAEKPGPHRHHRNRMPGPYPPGHAGRRCPLPACAEAGRIPAGRGCRGDADPRWRPPAFETPGYRQDARRGWIPRQS